MTYYHNIILNIIALNFVILFIISYLFLIVFKIKIVNNQYILIYISSCNRFYYLNYTIHSINKHMTNYESMSYHIILFDQGTVEIYNSYYINNKQIYNIFYMNPNGYIYTYNIIFSFLYSKYVLLIDDDRPVRYNIEKDLKHTNFISICLSVMKKNKDIYGIILKSEGDGNVKCYNNIINFHTIRFCKVEKGYIGYYYSNGASIYRTNELKKVKEYLGERYVAQFFGRTKYRMAYLLLNKMCKYLSNRCQFLFDHIGKNSSLQNRNICSVYLY